MRVEVAPDVSVHVVAGVLRVDDVTVTLDDPSLGEAMQRSAWVIAQPGDRAEVVNAVRGMYRRFGVDPTRTRPSSEALLRRVRKGEALPRINTLADIGNWCSLETGLPFGVYDADAVTGDVLLRIGAAGEEYAGIRKDVVHVAGRLVLADAQGPFGNPSSDSARTMVTPATRRTLMVIFTPRSLGAGAARDALRLSAGRVVTFAGGHVVAEEAQ